MFDIIIAFLVVSVADQVMLSSECLTSEEKKCVFPFKVKEKTHTGCTREGDPDKRFVESLFFKILSRSGPDPVQVHFYTIEVSESQILFVGTFKTKLF